MTNETPVKTQHTPFTKGLEVQRFEDGSWMLIEPASRFLIGQAQWVLEMGSEPEDCILAPAEANARLWAGAPEMYEALVVSLDADILRKAIDFDDRAVITGICNAYQDLSQDMTEQEALNVLVEKARGLRYLALQKACPPLWPTAIAKATGVQS